MFRGFAVYLSFLAGVYIATNAPFASPTPEQYARIAGALGLVAFVVGYDPTFFGQIVGAATRPRQS